MHYAKFKGVQPQIPSEELRELYIELLLTILVSASPIF
jgi:hypothetical protein